MRRSNSLTGETAAEDSIQCIVLPRFRTVLLPGEAFMTFTTTRSRPFLPLVHYPGIWSLITIMWLCVGPVCAEWVDVAGKLEKGLTVYTVYVDTDSIQRNGNIDLMGVVRLHDHTKHSGRAVVIQQNAKGICLR